MHRTGTPQRFGSSSWASGPDPAARPIDLAYLRRYTLGDASLEREVLDLFCDHAPVVLAWLKSASSEKAWREAAHTLKGSALSVGAWEVAREAERAEAASFKGAEEILAAIQAAIEDVRDFLAASQLEA